MATAVCAVLSVRLLTMARSSLLVLFVCLTVLLVLRPIIAEKDQTCVALQENKQQIWALGLNDSSYMLITSGGMVFTDIHKMNLVLSDGYYKLTIDVNAKTFKDAFPGVDIDIDFGNDTTTKLFIADPGQMPMVVVLKKRFYGANWNHSSLQAYSLIDGSSVRIDSDHLNRDEEAAFEYTDFIVSNGVNQSFAEVFELGRHLVAYKNKLNVEIFCPMLKLKLQPGHWNVNRFKGKCFFTKLGVDNFPKSGTIFQDGSSEVLLFFNYNKEKVRIVVRDYYGMKTNEDYIVPMRKFIECTDITTTILYLTSTTKGGFMKKHGSLIFATGVMMFLAGGVFAVCCWRRYQNNTDGRTKAQTSWFSLPTFGKKKRESYKPSKLPVSTDTSTIFAVAGRTSLATSSKPSMVSKAGSKATDPITSKFSFYITAQSIVSSIINKIANALGRQSKVNKASNALKTSTTSTPTTTSPALRKSKLSKSKVSKAPKIPKVSTALIASRASSASKKSKKKKKKPKTSRASRTSVVRTLTSMRKTSASSIATSKDVKKKIKKKSKK